MTSKKIQGIVLRKTPYKEKSSILTLFTKEKGVLSLFVKNSTKKQHILFSPLTEAEFVYQSKNQKYCSFQDGSIIDLHYFLRSHLESLEAASKMVKIILQTQLPGNKTPALYTLFSLYLKNVTLNPSSIVSSFLLKLMHHEGNLALNAHCCRCSEKALGLFQGESFCTKHLPSSGSLFSKDEWEILQVLVTVRKFEPLKALLLSKSLETRLEKLFFK